jgi:hypothetical protein
MHRGLQERWRSAQSWLTSISAAIGSDQPGREFCRNAGPVLSSAERWLTRSVKGGFELRGMVKPLVFFYRHLALPARCHLFSRQATKNSDILYTNQNCRCDGNKRYTLLHIQTLWQAKAEQQNHRIDQAIQNLTPRTTVTCKSRGGPGPLVLEVIPKSASRCSAR